MISRFFRRWEQQLAAVDTNRFVRPFEWGLDWLELADQAGTVVPGSDDPASDTHAAGAIDDLSQASAHPSCRHIVDT